MSGQPIRAEGEVDAAAIVALGERMAVISHRRGPVIGFSLLAWVLALGLALAARRRCGPALARPAVRLAGLAVVYLPLVLLAAAALEAGGGGGNAAGDAGLAAAGGGDAGAAARLPRARPGRRC